MIENNQAIETTELHQRILESITSSYASLLSNDMNNIMKTLTLFTVLLTLPTLVFSFFGMNVPLPIDDHSYVSWIIVVGISLILVAIVSIFLWKNKIITNTLSYRLALNLTKGIIYILKLCQNFKSLL